MSRRLVRDVSRNVKYQVNDDRDDLPCNKHTSRKHHHQQAGLSAARIASQKRKSVPSKQTHPIPVIAKKPRKVETVDTGADTDTQLPTPLLEDTDEDNIPLSKIKLELTAGETQSMSTKRKHVFVTR